MASIQQEDAKSGVMDLENKINGREIDISTRPWIKNHNLSFGWIWKLKVYARIELFVWRLDWGFIPCASVSLILKVV